MQDTALKVIDRLDWLAGRIGVAPVATWQDALDCGRLYAGKLYRHLPQYPTHIGLTPFRPSRRNIPHDVCAKMPLPDGAISAYQSEDVFEHIPYSAMPAILGEVYRVLKPGGLFRLSLPNYGCAILRDRSLRGEDGEIYFDPGGGGEYRDGEVVGGGHIWFPTYRNVRALFEASPFERVTYLHYTGEAGQDVLNPIDYSLGYIQRTPDHDPRAREPRTALSIVVDAYKA